MTSRERILAAIAHKEPDRVPVDLGSTPSSGISAIAYGNVKRHLGIASGHNRVYDVVQQFAQPEDEILNRFGIDVVDVARTFDTTDFGKDITFWGGGADTRKTLNQGTPQEVKDDVRRRMDILAPGGGFVSIPATISSPTCRRKISSRCLRRSKNMGARPRDRGTFNPLFSIQNSKSRILLDDP